jgi:hypothetical protein
MKGDRFRVDPTDSRIEVSHDQLEVPGTDIVIPTTRLRIPFDAVVRHIVGKAAREVSDDVPTEPGGAQ